MNLNISKVANNNDEWMIFDDDHDRDSYIALVRGKERAETIVAALEGENILLEFLNWLRDNKEIALCKYDDHGYFSARTSNQILVEDFLSHRSHEQASTDSTSS